MGLWRTKRVNSLYLFYLFILPLLIFVFLVPIQNIEASHTNLNVTKISINGNGLFNFTLTGPAAANTTGFFQIDTSDLNGTGSQFLPIDIGMLNITEVGIPPGFSLINATCTGTSGTIFFNSPSITINPILEGENVDCTFFNGLAPNTTLTINKNTTGGDGVFNFTVTGPSPSGFGIQTAGGNGSFGPFNITPGSYNITEVALPPGFSLTNTTCTIPFGFDSSNNRIGLFINGSEGNIACTFTNDSSFDIDNDGILNDVDTLPLNFSDAFSDVNLGSNTTGTILTRGDQNLTIKDETPNPNIGVRITADLSGGFTNATVAACGISTINFGPGSEIIVTCSSVKWKVIQGTIQVTVIGEDGTVGHLTLIEGDEITFNSETFSVINDGDEPVVIEVDGEEIIIDPGETYTDQCPNLEGPLEFQGCPFGDKANVVLHTIDQLNKINTKEPIEGAEVRVFDRNNAAFQTEYGTKNPSGTIYDVIFENEIGKVGSCSTNDMGMCIAGESTAGDYLVIVKYEDTETGKTVYTGLPKSPEDFVDGLATKDFQILKVVKKKDGLIQYSGGKKTVVTGSILEVVYPDTALWEDGVNSYVYPYIFTSDSDWVANLCMYLPEGYEVAGIYDEASNLVTTDSCTQTFVSGETKIAAFEVIDVGSPKKFNVDVLLDTKHNGKTKKLTLSTESKILEKIDKKQEKQAEREKEKQEKRQENEQKKNERTNSVEFSFNLFSYQEWISSLGNVYNFLKGLPLTIIG